MTLEQLRIFLAVAKTEHVTQAASALNLTQSAVSASIAALEATHGVQLFERVGRHIALSEAGRLFIDEAQAVLARAETARLALHDWSRHTMGRVRVHASQTVAHYWLPSRLVRMREKHPKVEISLTIGNSLQVMRAVLEGNGDLGLVEGGAAQAELAVRDLAEDEIALVMAKQHPLALRQSVSARDYRGLRWILREAGSGTRACFEAHLARHGLSLEQLDTMLELPSNEAVLAAVIADNGVSALSKRAVESAVAAGQAQAFPIADMKRSFAVLWRKQRAHTRATRALLAVLSEDAIQGFAPRRGLQQRDEAAASPPAGA